MRTGLFTRVWQGTAPLVVWAAHFFFCYLHAAAGGGRGVLVGVTALALAVAVWLLRQAARRRNSAVSVTSALAVIGIIWGGLPLFVG